MVAVVAGLAGRQDQVKVLADGDRVHIRLVGPPSRVIEEDIAEVRSIIKKCQIPQSKVWLMPCGTEIGEVVYGLQKLAPIALDYGWNLTGRQHVAIWGNKRGH